MTKAELLDVIAKANEGLTKKQVAMMVDAVFMTMAKAIVKDEEFSYPGFGSFKIRKRKARTGRNPQTGETMKIKASKTVGFKPAKSLKEKL
jgi:DNA-binding protein HU-beta